MEKINILLVEDEAIVAMDLAQRLQRLNFNIVGKAISGKQALDIFSHESVDLVLMDIHIKGDIDGIETAQQLAAIRPVPIIYLTAQTDVHTIDRAKHTLPAAYLTKPFDEKNLQIAIELAIHTFAFRKNTTETPPQYVEQYSSEKTDKKPSADSILKTENAIFIKQNYKFIKFKTADLLYLQADGSYTDLITTHHKYALRLTLNQALDKLDNPSIVRVHRSYAVNILNVEEFNDTEITVGKASVPLGTSFKEDFLKNFDFK
jgi:DNA-binding LytR/AlgR family response regulator